IGWQFLSWGLFYGILLVLEKSFLLKWMERCPAWIRRCYTMLMVILGFVIFRSTSLSGAWNFLQGMSGMLHLPLWDRNTAFYFKDLLFSLCLFIPFCAPILPTLRDITQKNQKLAKAGAVISIAAYPLIFLLCSAWIITQTPQPFLYFQF
ncbi:MAG: MBOAT family protein, partial [Lachnospiraceae bacterium]|nr:MBOAT family protein [Lachnospiraceae bacterium]